MSTVRTVYTNIKAARTAIKDFSRLRQISLILIRHGFGHVVASWNTGDQDVERALSEVSHENSAQKADSFAGIDLTESQPSQPLDGFERINEILQELGPTFVKLGQILSTRSDLIPQALCDQLKSLQDQVKPISFEEIKEMVETELEGSIEEIFSDFETEALACASIAQVHIATLHNGDEVVVKVQRPKIRETIESDISILHFLAKQAVEAIPEAEAFRPDMILTEFERAIIKELDFSFEARNLSRFERNFSDWETVHIPRYYKDVSTSRVMVMERLRGVKITEASPDKHPMDLIAQETVRMLFKQVFEDGFFHGDLHPGNLLVLEDSRIGLIDFGMIGRLTPPMRDAMADLLLHITTGHYEGVARSLYEISLHSEPINYGLWEADVIELMDQHFTHSSLADVDFGQIVRGLIEGAVRHKAQIPPDYTMFFKAIMTVEGIGKIVSPDLDLIAECRPYVQALITKRYHPERLMREVVDTLQGLARFSKRLPHTAQTVMQQIEAQQLGLQLRDSQLDRKEAHAQRLQNRATLTTLTIGLLGVSTTLSIWGGQMEWGGALSLLSGVAGTLIAIRLIWRAMILEEW